MWRGLPERGSTVPEDWSHLCTRVMLISDVKIIKQKEGKFVPEEDNENNYH